jgi:hypothetical protein
VLRVVGEVDLLGCGMSGEAGDGEGQRLNWHPSDAPKDASRARRERERGRDSARTASKLGCRDVPVQKEASAFLYISQMSPYLMGNMVKRSSLGSSRGSATRFSSVAFSATIFAVTAVCACVRRGVRVRYDDARGRKSFGRTCRRVEEWLPARVRGCLQFRAPRARHLSETLFKNMPGVHLFQHYSSIQYKFICTARRRTG